MIRNEITGTVYSYSLHHTLLCLANMYITMQLTQWFQPQVYSVIKAAVCSYIRPLIGSSTRVIVRISKLFSILT